MNLGRPFNNMNWTDWVRFCCRVVPAAARRCLKPHSCMYSVVWWYRCYWTCRCLPSHTVYQNEISEFYVLFAFTIGMRQDSSCRWYTLGFIHNMIIWKCTQQHMYHCRDSPTYPCLRCDALLAFIRLGRNKTYILQPLQPQVYVVCTIYTYKRVYVLLYNGTVPNFLFEIGRVQDRIFLY